MKIAVTGLTGQVARSLSERGRQLGVEVQCLGRPDFDLLNPEKAYLSILQTAADVVVSAAAYTDVDAAESDAEMAHAVNVGGAKASAEAARQMGVPIIHLSTDYVFSGMKMEPYIENDPTDPLSVYGRTKLEGERAVCETTADHVILRLAWVYSPFGSNFVKTMLRLAAERDSVRVVSDQFGRPTSALDIADSVVTVARRLKHDNTSRVRGTFHLSGQGDASWADLAEHVFEAYERETGRSVRVERISASEYATPASRPANSRLDNTKIADVYGLRMPEWRVSADTVLRRLLIR
jgi:dTDP-4-dehydrorhamnose reductase